jgi:hypothetical protein
MAAKGAWRVQFLSVGKRTISGHSGQFIPLLKTANK